MKTPSPVGDSLVQLGTEPRKTAVLFRVQPPVPPTRAEGHLSPGLLLVVFPGAVLALQRLAQARSLDFLGPRACPLFIECR